MEIKYLEKVSEFIDSLGIDLKKKVESITTMLEEKGHLIDMPFSKALGKGLFELRIIQAEHIRIFYCFHGGKAYLLHGFVKKTWRIPKRELEKAHVLKSIVDSL